MKTTVTRTRHRAAAALAVALVVGLLAGPASADDAPFTVDDGRIVGGQEVDPPGKYAFMVALVDSGSDSYYGQFCGAALIGPTWVLTAAHCVVGESAGDIDVVIGRHDLKGTEGERIGVGSITVHPGYNDRTTVNDIAVLKLESASSYGTVSLPSGGGLDTAGRIVTITGWGDTESIPRFPSKLQQVTAPATCPTAARTPVRVIAVARCSWLMATDGSSWASFPGATGAPMQATPASTRESRPCSHGSPPSPVSNPVKVVAVEEAVEAVEQPRPAVVGRPRSGARPAPTRSMGPLGPM